MLAATWATAIATVVLALLAVVTAWYARRAFQKQSEEVRAIERQVSDAQEVSRQQAELLELQRQQLDDQRESNARQAEIQQLQADELRESLRDRKREAAERFRAQASKVIVKERRNAIIDNPVGADGTYIHVDVINKSSDPIYDLELRWCTGVPGYEGPDPEKLGMVLPGKTESKSRGFPKDIDLSRCGSEVTFRDAQGAWWVASPDGSLSEMH
jgi:hypothetical protein